MNEIYIKKVVLNSWVTKYFKADLISIEELIATIEDLDDEVERLKEELEEKGKEYEEDYEEF